MLAAFAMLSIPAYAHDTLISTDPADGDTLESSPESITLTYSADILEVSPVVRIVDGAGEAVADVEPTVDGPEVTATLTDPLPAGDYTVQWRVVSSDGHPIEGSLDITVEQGPAAEDTAGQDPAAVSEGDGDDAAAGASDAGGAEESPAGSSTSSDSGGSSDATDPGEGDESGDTASGTAEESGSLMPLLLGVVGIVVVGAAIAAFFAVRRRS